MSNAADSLASVRAFPWRSDEVARPRPACTWDLTDRERNVAALLADGLPYKEMAVRLNISVNTVASHVKSILRKAGVNSSRRFAALWQASMQRLEG
jgi:DNA-binding CsgD family transcriptional regulator